MLLAIDTATRYASIALYDASGVISEASWRSRNNHSVETLPAVASMLALHGLEPQALTGLAVAKGPGSFTGLRIGMSIAKGLCLALGIPIVAIPTLDIVAYAVGDTGSRILCVLEAGRGRICVAAYRFVDGLPVQDGDIALQRALEWTPQASEPMFVAGEISAELAEHLLQLPNAEELSIASLAGSLRRAGYLAELAWNRFQEGATDDLDLLSPMYAQGPFSGTRL